MSTPAAEPMPVDLSLVVGVDLSTMTLGEWTRLEEQSGRSFDHLLRAGRMTRRMVALWLHEQRSSETPRSWHELSSLVPVVGSRSTSPMAPAGASETSNG